MPALIVILAILSAIAPAACSSAIPSLAIEDAQLGARVKTALVNDPDIGTRPIEVRVTGGVVRLIGRVDSADQAERAVALARAVPGVVEVVSELHVVNMPPSGPVDPVAPPVSDAPPPPAPQGGPARTPPDWLEPDDRNDGEPRLLAVGLSFGASAPPASSLRPDMRVGPLVRLGSGRGLGPAIGFGWFQADWRGDGPGEPLLGRVHIRPVMAGIAYGFRGDRASLSLSLVAGVALNAISLPPLLASDAIPIDLANSAAVRPGASVWLDLSRRVAFNVAASYVITRPRLTLLESGQVRMRALRADAVLLNTGIVYKLF